METHSVLEPGTVLPPGRLVPAGQLWGGNPAKFIRELTKDEVSARRCAGACLHADRLACELTSAAPFELGGIPWGTWQPAQSAGCVYLTVIVMGRLCSRGPLNSVRTSQCCVAFHCHCLCCCR